MQLFNKGVYRQPSTTLQNCAPKLAGQKPDSISPEASSYRIVHLPVRARWSARYGTKLGLVPGTICRDEARYSALYLLLLSSVQYPVHLKVRSSIHCTEHLPVRCSAQCTVHWRYNIEIDNIKQQDMIIFQFYQRNLLILLFKRPLSTSAWNSY